MGLIKCVLKEMKRIAMERKHPSGLRLGDLKRLMSVPESEIMGEIIRLNCTRYSNGLDVIRVCTLIRERRHQTL